MGNLGFRLNLRKFEIINMLISVFNIGLMGALYLLTILNLSGIGLTYRTNNKTILLFLCILIISNIRIFKKIKLSIVISYYLLIACFTMSLFLNIDSDIEYMINNILVMSSVYLFSFIGYNKLTIKLGSYLYSFITIYLLYDFNIGGITKGWNQNVIGMIGFLGVIYLGFIIIMTNKKRKVIRVFDLVLLFLLISLIVSTNNRSSLIGAILIFILYNLVLKKKISIDGYKFINFFVYFFPLIIVVIITYIYKSGLGANLDSISLEFTDKTFMNGREVIWNNAIESIRNNMLFGHGVMYPGNAHNLFIHIVYPFGLFGYIVYSLFYIFITYYMYNYLNDKIVRYSVCAFFTIYIQQSFEVLLFDIRTIVVINYLVLAIGIGRINKLKNYEMKVSNQNELFKAKGKYNCTSL